MPSNWSDEDEAKARELARELIGDGNTVLEFNLGCIAIEAMKAFAAWDRERQAAMVEMRVSELYPDLREELVRLRTEKETLKVELLNLAQATMLDLEEDVKRLEALREEVSRGCVTLETAKRYLDKLSNPAPTEP